MKGVIRFKGCLSGVVAGRRGLKLFKPFMDERQPVFSSLFHGKAHYSRLSHLAQLDQAVEIISAAEDDTVDHGVDHTLFESA